MFAVVESGGKQYRIEEGETLDVELLKIAQGEKITFDNVLMVGDGENVSVGRPVVEGAAVTATVVGEVKGPKVISFKHSGRSTLRKKTGHRQKYTRLHIDGISL